MLGFIVIALIAAALLYLGWFYGRLHEAKVEHQEELNDEAAYRWAVNNGRLPPPR